MFRLSKVVLCVFALLVASRADALPLSFSDTFDPADVALSKNGSTACHGTNGAIDTVTATTNCASLDWIHSLVTQGFNSATDTLTSGSIDLTFYDDADSPGDTFNISLDLLTLSSQQITSGTSAGAPFTVSYNVLSQISDGLLKVTLENAQHGNHDFFFAKAVLNAAGNRTTADDSPLTLVQTPEPASLMLFGTGLAAVAHRLRRRRG